LMQTGPTAPAILVELDRHERRLGLASQSRNSPGMRVALFEVVQGAMHEVLAHLLPGAPVTQVVGRTLSIEWLDRQRVHLIGGGVVQRDFADVITNGTQKRLFEATAHMQQSGVPLPPRIDAVETAVMQFIAD